MSKRAWIVALVALIFAAFGTYSVVGGEAAHAEPAMDNASADGEKKKKEKKDNTLCSQYDSCNACIAGQQAKGKSEGAAETECGLAVTGCWTTWEKPVVCGEKEHKEKKKK